MTSVQIQYIIVFVILGGVIAWLAYSLLRKKPRRRSACFGCSLAESCRKKDLYDKHKEKPTSCSDCPETDGCSKKSSDPGCGGNADRHEER